MPRRGGTNDGEVLPRSTAVDDLPMFAYPAGSQPKPSSEDAADRLVASGKAAILRRMCLERLGRGPVVADHFRAELEAELGTEIPPNSIPPRFSELQDDGYAYQDTTVTLRTRYNGPAHPYAITEAGRAALARIAGMAAHEDRLRYVHRFGRKV